MRAGITQVFWESGPGENGSKGERAELPERSGHFGYLKMVELKKQRAQCCIRI